MRKGFSLMLLGLAAISVPLFGSVSIDFGESLTAAGTVTVNSTSIVGAAIDIGAVRVQEGSGVESFATTGSCGGDACLTFDITSITSGTTGGSGTGTGTLEVQGGIVGKTGLYSSTFNTPGTVASYGTATTPLMNSGASAIDFSWTTSMGVLSILASGPDGKDQGLLNDLGLGSLYGTATTGWSVGGAPNDGFVISTQETSTSNVYDATSYDLLDSPAVPEPTSVLLLGTVLFGVTNMIRRRSRSASSSS